MRNVNRIKSSPSRQVKCAFVFCILKRLQHHENRKCSSWFRRGGSRSRGHGPPHFHSRQRRPPNRFHVCWPPPPPFRDHWQIQAGAPLLVQFLSFSSCLEQNLCQIIGCYIPLWDFPLGNPESATKKSPTIFWIYYWNFWVFFHFTHFKVIKNAVSFQPCYCSAYVHVTCLQKWLQVSKTHTCEVCNFQFKAERRMKPISQVINHVLRMYLFPFVLECLTLLQ